jgi:hypothetical protein
MFEPSPEDLIEKEDEKPKGKQNNYDLLGNGVSFFELIFLNFIYIYRN